MDDYDDLDSAVKLDILNHPGFPFSPVYDYGSEDSDQYHFTESSTSKLIYTTDGWCYISAFFQHKMIGAGGYYLFFIILYI